MAGGEPEKLCRIGATKTGFAANHSQPKLSALAWHTFHRAQPSVASAHSTNWQIRAIHHTLDWICFATFDEQQQQEQGKVQRGGLGHVLV